VFHVVGDLSNCWLLLGCVLVVVWWLSGGFLAVCSLLAVAFVPLRMQFAAAYFMKYLVEYVVLFVVEEMVRSW
jgi:hypothetical protein